MIDVKDFNTFIPTAKDFEDFVNLLIKNKINFHPEDDFNDYTNQDGSKTFTKDIADIVGQNFDIALQTLSEEVFWKICFNAFRKVNKDIVDCDKCSGKGYYYDDDNDLINCPRCHGEGTHTKELELEELQAKAWKQRYPNGFKSDK